MYPTVQYGGFVCGVADIDAHISAVQIIGGSLQVPTVQSSTGPAAAVGPALLSATSATG